MTDDYPIPIGHADRIERLRSLAVGDSEFVPADEKHRWRAAMTAANSTGEVYLISRTVEGGIRIWRKS